MDNITESKFILDTWARVWPKKFFNSENEWLEYCRKWTKVFMESKKTKKDVF